ncbi:MAG: biotin/lipoyl-containing protein, partial [Actinomycetota bacterium]
VTGIDLAKLMIRIAEGESLPFSQADIGFRGHAIECRINAEDAVAGFMPHPGHISRYAEPSGPGVRVDSAAGPGTEIPESYDSLIAKLICWGSDRPEAIARTRRALQEYVINGLPTTIPFHKEVMASDWFASGRFSTRTVEEDMDLSRLERQPSAKRPRRPVETRRVVTVEVEGRAYEVKFTERQDPAKSRRKPTPPDLSKRSGPAHGEDITAPMQGTIVRVLVEEGQRVKAGDAICVLEAMKMENMISCHRDGTVRNLRVSAGDTVPTGAVIAEIGD